MVIAVITVGMMEMAVDQIVDVVPVRHRLVPAAGSMHVMGIMTTAGMRRRASIGIGGSHRNGVLVDMVSMRMVEVPVMQVIDVTVVLHRSVPATGAMFMIVIRVFLTAH